MSQVTENKAIAAPVPMTPLQEFWHYFKRNKGAVVGLVYGGDDYHRGVRQLPRPV
jgi:dipeptide transport system permease protein